MAGFESFIYNLGAIVFSGAITGAAFYVVDLIERPRGRK